jgi:hypothetical protein
VRTREAPALTGELLRSPFGTFVDGSATLPPGICHDTLFALLRRFGNRGLNEAVRATQHRRAPRAKVENMVLVL